MQEQLNALQLAREIVDFSNPACPWRLSEQWV